MRLEALAIAAMIGLGLLILGCATNPCIDNPRSMACMSPAEIEAALQ